MVHIFIKINATWIIHLLSFVARYFGVIQCKINLSNDRNESMTAFQCKI